MFQGISYNPPLKGVVVKLFTFKLPFHNVFKFMKLTPLKSVRKQCLFCMDNQSNEITLCPSDGKTTDKCPLWNFRFGKRIIGVSVMKAIKTYCKICVEIVARKCPFSECSLFPYKQGRNPARKGIGGDRGVFLKRGR